jgi:hypothetical protein
LLATNEVICVTCGFDTRTKEFMQRQKVLALPNQQIIIAHGKLFVLYGKSRDFTRIVDLSQYNWVFTKNPTQVFDSQSLGCLGKALLFIAFGWCGAALVMFFVVSPFVSHFGAKPYAKFSRKCESPPDPATLITFQDEESLRRFVAFMKANSTISVRSDDA